MVIWSTVFGKSFAEIIPDFTAFALFTGKTNLETGKKLKRSYLSSPKSNFKISSFSGLLFSRNLRRL